MSIKAPPTLAMAILGVIKLENPEFFWSQSINPAVALTPVKP
jgi:hypothetical protein